MSVDVEWRSMSTQNLFLGFLGCDDADDVELACDADKKEKTLVVVLMSMSLLKTHAGNCTTANAAVESILRV